jgi:hypothetical protein
MPSPHSRRRRAIFWAASLSLIAAGCWLVAASQRKPARDEVQLDDVLVVVDYSPSAGSQDLQLPFYPGARVETSFRYKVNTQEGESVTSYAFAVLITADSPERVSQHYSGKLPGRPKPELVSDKAGKRYVLAVASPAEVRRVTITAEKGGARIELVRASGVATPKKPLRPRARGQQVA